MKSDRETFRSVSRGCTSFLTSLGLSFLGAKWEHKHLPTGVSHRPCDIMHKVPQSQLSLADFTYSYNSGNGYILIKDYKGRMCVCVCMSVYMCPVRKDNNG